MTASGGEGGGAASPRALAALESLIAIGARLAAAQRLSPPAADPALRAIAEAAVAALQVTAASIALHDRATDRLVFRAAAGPEGAGVVGMSIASHEGIAGYAFGTGQPLAIADVVADPRFGRAAAEQTGYVPRSILAVPLTDGDGTVGVMEWLDRIDGHPFDLADLDVATRVAAAATATARATSLDQDADRLLVGALTRLSVTDADDLDVEALVESVATGLGGHDGVWRLADRIGRLRAADPDDIELAIEWLDALLARMQRRSRTGRVTRA